MLKKLLLSRLPEVLGAIAPLFRRGDLYSPHRFEQAHDTHR